MNKYSSYQIASDYRLWMEYVDPSGIDSEADFNAMTIERKLEIQQQCFGAEVESGQ